jgi:hypothetical protein
MAGHFFLALKIILFHFWMRRRLPWLWPGEGEGA